MSGFVLGNLPERKTTETDPDQDEENGGATMKRRGRDRAVEDEDDERLACAALAELREGWQAERRTMRAWAARRSLEACALDDDDQMAWRPSGPDLVDLLMADEPVGSATPAQLRDATSDLPRETRRALALWTRYSLACLELGGGGRRTGDA
jgi:hypothetical protein